MELSFDLFTKTQTLYNKNIFVSNNCFSYLGKNLNTWLEEFLTSLGVEDSPVLKSKVDRTKCEITGRVYIDENVLVEPYSYIKGPCYIGKGSEVRQAAYIRGNVYVGAGCVVGHTTEVKSSVFLDGAKAGHFSYVGDSILGQNSNLGAGTKLANLKFNNSSVSIKDPISNKRVDTGLRKLGTIVGDRVQFGCNSVTNPGTLILPDGYVLPASFVRGTIKNKL